ncbi:MAG: MoaD/ThiS family protein [Thermodesulfobacteriota bacterium]
MSAQLKDLTRQQQTNRLHSGQVKVSYGVHNLEAAIAGKSVSEVRQALREPLNIDPRALALVNGRDVAASYILKDGDQLEFVRLAGEKGRYCLWPFLPNQNREIPRIIFICTIIP